MFRDSEYCLLRTSQVQIGEKCFATAIQIASNAIFCARQSLFASQSAPFVSLESQSVCRALIRARIRDGLLIELRWKATNECFEFGAACNRTYVDNAEAIISIRAMANWLTKRLFCWFYQLQANFHFRTTSRSDSAAVLGSVCSTTRELPFHNQIIMVEKFRLINIEREKKSSIEVEKKAFASCDHIMETLQANCTEC